METRPHEGLASLPPAPQSHLGTLIPLVMLESQPPVSWFSQPGWQGSGRGTQVGDSGETTHRTGDRKLFPAPAPSHKHCLCCPSSAKTSPSWGMATTCRRPYSLPDMAHNVVARLSCWPQEQGQRTTCWELHEGTQPEDMGTPSCVFISGFLPGNQESGIASMAQKALLGSMIPADSWKNRCSQTRRDKFRATSAELMPQCRSVCGVHGA